MYLLFACFRFFFQHDVVHQLHKCYRRVAQSRWHYKSSKDPMLCLECSLQGVLFVGLNLLSKLQVHLGEYFSILQLVEEFVDVRKTIVVLNGHLVEGTVIDALSSPFVLLRDQYHRRAAWELLSLMAPFSSSSATSRLISSFSNTKLLYMPRLGSIASAID